MRGKTWAFALGLAVVASTLSACAGLVPYQLEDEAGFLGAVREQVSSAAAYDDGDLVDAGERICLDAPATEPAVRLLAEEYEEIAGDERELLAYLALTVACPGPGADL